MDKLIVNNTLDSTSRTIIICVMIFNILYSLFELFSYEVDLFGIIIFLIMLIPTVVLGGIMTMKTGLVSQRGNLKKATFLFGIVVDTSSIDDINYKTVGSIALIRQQKGNDLNNTRIKDVLYDVSIFKESPSQNKKLFTSNSIYKIKQAINFIINNSYLKAYEMKS